jgi:phage shock protein A
MANEKEDIIPSDPPTDPAQAFREARRLIAEALTEIKALRESAELHVKNTQDLNTTVELSAKDIAELKREWEADHAEHVTTRNALKRSVLQFFTNIGWIERK